VAVPKSRTIARKYKDLSLGEVRQLLKSKIHEERLIALFILVDRFKKGSEPEKKEIFDFYIASAKYVNNWDLVDSSAGYIVGAYLDGKPKDILKKLARSGVLWERRIAMISTFHFLYKKEPKYTLEIAGILIDDKNDLIQKAVGWMLRELGKRCSREIEEEFLVRHYKKMGRTALRYAIEHFDEEKRKSYLSGAV
jgi:3-methyladenine DNA glycosylase AlkD